MTLEDMMQIGVSNNKDNSSSDTSNHHVKTLITTAVTTSHILYYNKLVRYASNFTKNREVAEEIVQDSYMKLAVCLDAKKDTPADITNFNTMTWLYTVVRNSSINYCRDQKRRYRKYNIYAEESPRFSEDVFDHCSNSEIRAYLITARNGLRENHNTILDLYYRDGFSHQKIAERLNIKPGTVMSRLWRARDALKLIICCDERYELNQLFS